VAVAASERASVREIFRPPYARRSAMLWIFQALQTVGYYGFGTIAPLVLHEKGYEIVETLGFTALIYLGYPLGSALSVLLMDRFERKHLIMGSALAIGAFGLIFGFARAEWLILAAGLLTTAVSNVFSNSFHIYQAEIFPTRMRSTAVGIAYSLSRVAGAVLPFITVSVLDSFGATAVFMGSATIMIVLCLDVGLLGPRSTGRNLEDASDEVPAEVRERPAPRRAPRRARAAPARPSRSMG
jgi:MFS transporter, putative metabolite:H+ symporter